MSDLSADLALSVFLVAFRKQLAQLAAYPGIDIYTPGQVLDGVIRGLDLALMETKVAQSRDISGNIL